MKDDPNVDLLKQFISLLEKVDRAQTVIRADIAGVKVEVRKTAREIETLKKKLTKFGTSWESKDTD